MGSFNAKDPIKWIWTSTAPNFGWFLHLVKQSEFDPHNLCQRVFKNCILLLIKQSNFRKSMLKCKKKKAANIPEILGYLHMSFRLLYTLHWTFKLILRSLNRYRQRGHNLSCQRLHWFQDAVTRPWICQKRTFFDLWTSCLFTPYSFFKQLKKCITSYFYMKDVSLKIIFSVYSLSKLCCISHLGPHWIIQKWNPRRQIWYICTF